jgi:hypothetical protein
MEPPVKLLNDWLYAPAEANARKMQSSFFMIRELFHAMYNN